MKRDCRIIKTPKFNSDKLKYNHVEINTIALILFQLTSQKPFKRVTGSSQNNENSYALQDLIFVNP